MDAIGKSERDIKGKSAGPFVTSFASLLVIGFVLSWHFSQQGSDGMDTLRAVHSAAILWLGFIVTSMATNNAFQGAKAKLTVLDSAHWLGVLIIEALIVSLL